ncbi:MAG: hypothetical protein WCJ09_12020 [Planctomycetota bacterium]
MTTVGKILVVLHLVLSIMFMAFAGAVFTAQKNWRKTAEATAGQLAKAKASANDQRTEFERERTDTAAKVAELNDQVLKLTGEKGALFKQSTDLQADNNRLQTAIDAVGQQAELQTKEATERFLDSKVQVDKNKVAYETREALQKRLLEVEKRRDILELEQQQMKDRHERVLTDLQIFKQYYGAKGLLTDPKLMVVQSSAPPGVDGVVTEYRKEKKGASSTELVEISLGSDEGLGVGHKMTVYNGEGRYLGQIRLTLVQPDKAVGLVIANEKAKNTVIQKGDYVTTKLR